MVHVLEGCDCGRRLWARAHDTSTVPAKKNKSEALLGTKEGELSLAHVASSKPVSTLDDPAVELYLIE